MWGKIVMKNFKKAMRELRMLIGDYFLTGALRLYPEGEERISLAVKLGDHFRLMTGDGP